MVSVRPVPLLLRGGSDPPRTFRGTSIDGAAGCFSRTEEVQWRSCDSEPVGSHDLCCIEGKSLPVGLLPAEGPYRFNAHFCETSSCPALDSDALVSSLCGADGPARSCPVSILPIVCHPGSSCGRIGYDASDRRCGANFLAQNLRRYKKRCKKRSAKMACGHDNGDCQTKEGVGHNAARRGCKDTCDRRERCARSANRDHRGCHLAPRLGTAGGLQLCTGS